jgi:hypothetical protein
MFWKLLVRISARVSTVLLSFARTRMLQRKMMQISNAGTPAVIVGPEAEDATGLFCYIR